MKRSRAPRRRSRTILLCAVAAAVAGCAGEPSTDEATDVTASAIENAMPFGTMCQEDFQNNWREYLSATWTRCNGFNNRFDDVATLKFYYNLINAKPAWETTPGSAGAYYIDSVYMFYASTHGGAWSDTATYTMWNQDSRAFTRNMRLNTLSVLSTYACETLRPDSAYVTRWLGTMAGGLRLVTGSHGLVYSSWVTDDVGTDYASNLASQWSVKDAWQDGNWDWAATQDLAVTATGTTVDDCYGRLNGITAYNQFNYPRLYDGSIAYLCYQNWTQ